jgi:predicted nuclease with TOPRIM domain
MGVCRNANQNGVNEANAVRKELDATRKERDELEERIERIRRENSKKCCEIM